MIEEMKLFDAQLLEWYDANARELPWRGEKDPYRIWLSEIMLQQTRAETVCSYYPRFLNAFENVSALANAELDQVLKLWEGLGYYSRVRNLHAAARRIHFEMQDCFPKDAKALRKLPGIGPYAANAIASIAYGEYVAALDGNQARVLSRVTAHETPLKTPFDLEEEAMRLISKTRPGDYNQALMDLGTAVCVPKAPKCEKCPVKDFCQAYAEGDPESYPKKLPPIAKKTEQWLILIVAVGGKICVRRRGEKGLLGGLYEFPCVQNALSPEAGITYLNQTGFQNPRMERELPESDHVFTHLIWKMRGYLCRADAAGEGFMLTDAPETLAFPSALRVYREIAQEITAEDN